MSAAGKVFESPPKSGFYPAEQKAAIEAEGTLSAGSRSEKSLGILTTKFVTLLQEVSQTSPPAPGAPAVSPLLRHLRRVGGGEGGGGRISEVWKPKVGAN